MSVHGLVDLDYAVKIIKIGKFDRNNIALIVKVELSIDLAAVRITETREADDLVARFFGRFYYAVNHRTDHRFVDA